MGLSLIACAHRLPDGQGRCQPQPGRRPRVKPRHGCRLRRGRLGLIALLTISEGTEAMALGTHNFRQDPRNAEILISVNGALYPRDKAMVSVFDSGFILGDGVWEGLRMHDGG